MAETYQSTNKKSEDTKPERRRLIHEGSIGILSTAFGSFDSGFIGQAQVDISNFNQIKSVWQERGPVTFDVEIMHVVQEGSEFTFFQKAPYYRRYDNAGLKTAWCNAGVLNQVVIGDDIYISTLYIDYFTSANTILDRWSAYYTQEFRYKIWSTLY